MEGRVSPSDCEYSLLTITRKWTSHEIDYQLTVAYVATLDQGHHRLMNMHDFDVATTLHRPTSTSLDLWTTTELRSCVKVEVAVLGSRPYGFCGRKATVQPSINVDHHSLFVSFQ